MSSTHARAASDQTPFSTRVAVVFEIDEELIKRSSLYYDYEQLFSYPLRTTVISASRRNTQRRRSSNSEPFLEVPVWAGGELAQPCRPIPQFSVNQSSIRCLTSSRSGYSANHAS